MSRVPPVVFDELSPEGQKIYKEIAGPRDGAVGGPYTVWLRTPEIADIFNKVGDVLRVRGKLTKKLQELMVLVLSREWNCQYQWVVHEAAARSNGLADDTIEAIRHGKKPNLTTDDERAVYDVVTELIATKALSDATYQRALAVLGMDILIELVTNSGRYTQAAMVINAFQVPVPGDAKPLPAI
jgi:4-carboxymuconolactone decarboxylase